MSNIQKKNVVLRMVVDLEAGLHARMGPWLVVGHGEESPCAVSFWCEDAAMRAVDAMPHGVVLRRLGNSNRYRQVC